jgi:hypothetical protein
METILSVEGIIREVQAEIGRLEQVLKLLGHSTAPVHKLVKTGKPRRKMSAAGRKRIAAAQKARWAKIRAAKK